MNQQQFLAALQERLNGLPQSDIEKSLAYYREMIEDHVEEGASEEEAVAEMGSVEEIAAQILTETSLPKLIKAKAKPARALKAWEIALLALGSPLWAPLLLAVIILILSLYVVLWSVILCLYAVDFSFAAVALSGILGAIALACTGVPLQAVFSLGAGVFSAGAAILLFFGFGKITAQILKLSKKILLWVKSWFIRKGEAK